MMKKILLFFSLFVFTTYVCNAQQWVDTAYTYQLFTAVSYGNAVDFAGNLRNLDMDICVPTNDVPPVCGRPLLIVIHGGSFMAGTKNDIIPQVVMKDFAKRGYITASINYRLGMFETSSNIHCNIGNGWDCLNMADTAEWLRATYRAMQDAKGAIRYLIAHAGTYNIDPKNVFVVGESAGAITALATAYLDDNSEKFPTAGAMSDATAPNPNYEGQCIQTYGFDTSIASMQLQRPDLGSIEGTLNPTGGGYTIKGVAAFYGGMFSNLFAVNNYATAPALYMFHQPNDLLVPYTRDRVLAGYANCAVTMGGCQYIINRPFISGGRGMVNYIQQTAGPVPQYIFDSTFNNADCLQQVSDPNTIGHAVDNYSLRTLHIAQLFAAQVDTAHACFPAAVPVINSKADVVNVYPNPATDKITILVKDQLVREVVLSDLKSQKQKLGIHNANTYDLPVVAPGIYFLQIRTDKSSYMLKIIKE